MKNWFKKDKEFITFQEWKGVKVFQLNGDTIYFKDADDYRIDDEGIYIYKREVNVGFVKHEYFTAVFIIVEVTE